MNLWRIGAEQGAQVAVEKHSLWIERGPDALEVMPARIERAQLCGSSCVHLAPVWATLVAFEDLFDVLEIRSIGHSPVHMHGDISRIALISWAEPDIVGLHKAALYRKVNPELIFLDTLPYLVDDATQMLCRDIVFHLLEAHQARRSKHAIAIVNFVDVGDGSR